MQVGDEAMLRREPHVALPGNGSEFSDGARAFSVQRPVVLLVDDSATTAAAVRILLSDEPDIELHYCKRAEEALSMATGRYPTVILQDLLMPGIDGLSLVRQFREHAATRDIPIIVLSSREEPTVKGSAFAAGANDYLVKLPDKIELIARIRYHSRAYMNLLQRDEAYRVLRASQRYLEETNKELTRLYSLDGLTNIANRRFFDEVYAREWRRSARDRAPLSLILIDIDFFKGYNDTYGHQAGDECLRQVAATVNGVLKRPADLAARYGGEEFVVVLPGTHREGAAMLAEQMRSKVQALQIAHERSLASEYVTISVGIATIVPDQISTAKMLIEAADTALYVAKREGRNCVRSTPL